MWNSAVVPLFGWPTMKKSGSRRRPPTAPRAALALDESLLADAAARGLPLRQGRAPPAELVAISEAVR